MLILNVAMHEYFDKSKNMLHLFSAPLSSIHISYNDSLYPCPLLLSLCVGESCLSF